MDLYNQEESIQFYEKRYAKGYMDEWEPAKKQRVWEIIKDLNLPDTGEALDFGCGTGVFTEVIKKALPHWRVYGTDISATAIDRATERHTDCNFFVLSDNNFKNKKFEFLFTHHVLEHVYSINNVIEEIVNFMKPSSSCLHILPCGNSGSFEHKICLLTRNGINKDLEGRFFFEDEGHVRRLNTEQMSLLLKHHNLILNKEYYAHQYYGAINWILSNREHIMRMTNPVDGLNLISKFKLLILRAWLILIYILIRPANYVKKFKERTKVGIKQYIFLSIGIFLYPLSALVYNYIKDKSEQEWRLKKTYRNGSEMYLYYKRIQK
ncbi:MAG: class I SAM-dependent methyltransferase [Deltaproteobacteria bacterium]|nr:class I SAM-dependent methyltransferase [Deltaproteobacteria bacterium]